MDVGGARPRLAVHLCRHTASAPLAFDQVPVGTGVQAMAGVTFVPTYQGLSAADLLRPWAPLQPADFPMSVPHRLAFYRARNAIYHLFRALAARTPGLT